MDNNFEKSTAVEGLAAGLSAPEGWADQVSYQEIKDEVAVGLVDAPAPIIAAAIVEPHVAPQLSPAAAAWRAKLALADQPGRQWANGLDWPTILWIGIVHLGALAAPFAFTWSGLAIFCVLSWMTGGLGITLGFHRLLTHNGFKTYNWVRNFLALCGTLAGEGPPVTWVAVHRKHHRFSDHEGDPHSPHDGAWWSHVLWLFPRPRNPEWRSMLEVYGKDLLKEPFMVMLDRYFLAIHIGLALSLLGIGWAIGGWRLGLSYLIYGSFLRTVYVLHITWAVNSASHMWGYRNYETKDDSRNLWWVGLLAFGEGWHNNHHAYPAVAQHGHKWWEFDLTWNVLRLMERVGLAWKIIRPKPEQLKKAAQNEE